MGFWDQAGGKIRDLLRGDKERLPVELAKGSTSSSIPVSGFDLLNAYGYDLLQDYLRLDTDLLARYSEYEEMDDIPEISCLAGDSMVFTLEWGWTQISDLAARGGEFHVLAYDRNTRSLVPAKAVNARMTGAEGHGEPMVRVVFDNGQSMRVTEGHLFMLKDGTYLPAGGLSPGARLMPGVLRTRSMNDDSVEPYWQVHQPQEDSAVRSGDGKRWVWLHRLVAEVMFGGLSEGDVVHHRDEDKLCNAPSNLSLETRSSHASHHIAQIDNSSFFPPWTDERRRAFSQRMLGNTNRNGAVDSLETRERKSRARAGKPLSSTHRERIGNAHRMDLPPERIEAALRGSASLVEAAKKLGVSWSTVKRHAERHDLLNELGNHRVVRVERLESREAVYDLEVPGLHNFVCNGVVVHNCAFDIYADDATQVDISRNRVVWAESTDENTERLLTTLFDRSLRFDEEIQEIARTVVKYGNDYEELLVTGDGVVGLNFLPPPTARRVEGRRGELFGFIQDYKGRFGFSPDDFKQALAQRLSAGHTDGVLEKDRTKTIALEDWEVVHFRLRSKYRRSMYGYGVAESARWIWKRLMLLEDAAMIFRLSRAPERYAFYIDVGDMPPKEAFALMNKVRQNYRKKKWYNPATGKVDQKYDPVSQDEDFFFPSKNGKDGTRAEVLNSPVWQSVEDVSYFRDKLFAALKVPKAYMNADGSNSRGSLSQNDVRFARSVLRVQRELRNGIRKICRVHLAALGIDPSSVDFDVHMTIPSSIFELAQLEVKNAQAEFATRMQVHVSEQWILGNIFKFSDRQVQTIMAQKTEEAHREIASQMAAQQDPAGAPPPADAPTQDAGPPRNSNAPTARPQAGGARRRYSDSMVDTGLTKIKERELMAGNRKDEQMLERSPERMLAHPAIMARLNELSTMLMEIRQRVRS